MSLLAFHRILIGVAVLFCFGYGIWEIAAPGRPAGAGSPVVGALFLVFAAAFGAYFVRMARVIRLGGSGGGDEETDRSPVGLGPR